MRRASRRRALRQLAGLALLAALSTPAVARAAPQVDLEGRVVALSGRLLLLDVDGILLELDVSEVDQRLLALLRPGDEVVVTAFRLPDGSLLVYNLFLREDGGGESQPVDAPQGGTE